MQFLQRLGIANKLACLAAAIMFYHLTQYAPSGFLRDIAIIMSGSFQSDLDKKIQFNELQTDAAAIVDDVEMAVGQNSRLQRSSIGFNVACVILFALNLLNSRQFRSKSKYLWIANNSVGLLAALVNRRLILLHSPTISFDKLQVISRDFQNAPDLGALVTRLSGLRDALAVAELRSVQFEKIILTFVLINLGIIGSNLLLLRISTNPTSGHDVGQTG